MDIFAKNTNIPYTNKRLPKANIKCGRFAAEPYHKANKMSYSQNYQHIVFATKYRQNVIPEDTKRILFKFIHELCIREGWYLVRINAYLNHVHILIDIPPTARISDVVKLIKVRTTQTFKEHPSFPNFQGWGKSYGSFSVSYLNKTEVINYIANQEHHHSGQSFESELGELLISNGLTPDQYINSL